MWGGGATWGCGTASAQIISSDANARYGIDLTHLAAARVRREKGVGIGR